MLAHRFVSKTVKEVANFFEVEFRRRDFPMISFFRSCDPNELPNLTHTERPRIFGFRNSPQPLLILPTRVDRINQHRNTHRESGRVDRNGEVRVVSYSSPEDYLIDLAVFGPSGFSELGQELLSCFVAVILDHSQVHAKADLETETIRLSERMSVIPEVEATAQRFRMPSAIYGLRAELQIETKTALKEDLRVMKKPIIHSQSNHV